MNDQPELSFTERPEPEPPAPADLLFTGTLRERYDAAHALLAEMNFNVGLALMIRRKKPKRTPAEHAAAEAELKKTKRKASAARRKAAVKPEAPPQAEDTGEAPPDDWMTAAAKRFSEGETGPKNN